MCSKCDSSSDNEQNSLFSARARATRSASAGESKRLRNQEVISSDDGGMSATRTTPTPGGGKSRSSSSLALSRHRQLCSGLLSALKREGRAITGTTAPASSAIRTIDASNLYEISSSRVTRSGSRKKRRAEQSIACFNTVRLPEPGGPSMTSMGRFWESIHVSMKGSSSTSVPSTSRPRLGRYIGSRSRLRRSARCLASSAIPETSSSQRRKVSTLLVRSMRSGA